MRSPPVIITRAEPGATETAKRLSGFACQPIQSPVLKMVAHDIDCAAPLAAASGIIFTSANGVRAFAERSERRDMTAWCVGPATSTAAETIGFKDVRNAMGASGELAALIQSETTPENGPLVHVANIAAAGDLANVLRLAGFNVVFLGLYEMRPAPNLSRAACLALETASTGVVLVHSAKGAAAFRDLFAVPSMGDWIICAVSEQAAQPLRSGPWARFAIAERPNEAALLQELESVLATL